MSRRPWRSMINLDGASLIFPTSFGYFDPHMLAMCGEVSHDVQFRHCGGLWDQGQAPDEHRLLLRLYRRWPSTSPASLPAHTTQERASWASSPPSRSPRSCATSTPSLLGAQLGRTRRPPLAKSSSPATGRCRSRKRKRPTRWSTRAPMSSLATSTARRWWSRQQPRRGTFVCGYHANQSQARARKTT